jgi:broad specificity phosphatase PhoE
VLSRWRAVAVDLASHADDILVVTHDAVVRCALVDLQALGLRDFWNVSVENAAFAIVDNDGTELRLTTPFFAEHLRGLRADVASQAL